MQDCLRVTGIIPTRMGTSSCNVFNVDTPTDHPHAYGDKTLMFGFVEVCHGSSPRVWGQVIFSPLATRLARIIPTRMGTRTAQLIPLTLPEDHPHAYGDKTMTVYQNGQRPGSSPRVWGQVLKKHKADIFGRIIPTRMGTSHICPSVSFRNKDHPHAYGDKI